MPELPEVETIRRSLEPRVLGRRFVRTEVFDPAAVLSPCDPLRLDRELRGRRVTELARRGKYLIFRLDGGSLVIHLRMTGVLLLDGGAEGCRVRFELDDGSRLLFCDRRRLGGLWLVEDESSVVGRLGPEPLEDSFTPELLGDILRGRRAPIKAVLLDQEAIAGLGNMYADEALFLSGVHPLRRACEVTPEELGRLHRAIRSVLEAGIRAQGASVETYRLPDGTPGGAQLLFKVAHRAGHPCPVCGAAIERVSIRNRGAYFCPRCQK